ncbi:hypothetical protein ACIA8E_01785 [Streptomyces sp. NPDC051664]|uniref:hypothetical protein n=1 Tax=Streptomyces sp. NPDC051664 TaxID=3365668 RepID=UPI00378BB353
MTPPPADLAAARRSLEGLSLGDASGERWFPLFRAPQQARNEIRARRTPAATGSAERRPSGCAVVSR